MSHHLKSITLIFAALFSALAFSVPQAAAQELTPEHLALARKYVDLTDKSQVYERALIQTGINTMRTIVGQNPEISEQVSESIGTVIQGYSTQKDSLMNQFARVYAIRFTEAELEQIVAFYESEVGQKLAEQNSEASGDLSAVMRVFQNNLNTEFYAKVRAELREQDISI